MIKVEVSGFSNREQAEMFIAWYDGSGEQSFEYWTEDELPSFSPYVDLKSTYPLNWEGDTVKLVLAGDRDD